MKKQISKIQNKTNKVFALFQKMIARLEKYNAKVEKMLEKSENELEVKRKELLELEEKVNDHLEHGWSVIDSNIRQIKTLKELMGKDEE